MTLDAVPSRTRLFLDSTIFVYHFTGASRDCERCLERCERSDLRGVTSAVVLAEVAHRLMMLEARSRDLLAPGNLARKLRERPDVVRQLHAYQEQVERIPLLGVEILPLDLPTFLRSADVRRRHGLLVNDSLVAAAMLDAGIEALASADRDFERLDDVRVYRPGDLSG